MPDDLSRKKSKWIYIYIYIIKLYPELLVLLDNVFRRGMFVILSDLEKSS